MANRFDVKTRTFFQIPPEIRNPRLIDTTGSPVVFMDHGFNLRDVEFITEPVMERDLHYTFSVYLTLVEYKKLTFEFKRKQDCLMAQREMTRAWTRTGEFKYEDVQTGESTSVERRDTGSVGD